MKTRFTIALLAALLVGCAAPYAAQPSPPATVGRLLTVLFTGDSRGAVEPAPECACYDKPVPMLGGLARRATYVQRVRAADPGVLLVDVGDTVADPDGRADDPAQRRRVALALGAMAYDAITPGPAEIAAAEPAWVDALGAPLLAANLRGAAILRQASALKTVGGVKVAMLGALSPAALPADVRTSLGVEVAPAAEALRPRVAELRPDADLLAVLFHGSFAEARDLAAELDGVDLVVAGRRAALPHPSTRVGGALVVQAPPEGRQVGRIRLAVAGPGQVSLVEEEQVTITEELADDAAVRALLGPARG
jgi:2',3'-cyclic-nucleotide 2'-phosphodiesterase (5'-nucleotidase family)